MIEWNEMHLQIREMMRRFVEQEVKPNLEKLEHGDLPPYEILRKMIKSFGIADMAKARFARDKDRPPRSDEDKPKKPSDERGMEVAMSMIPIIELCRYSPGMVTALSATVGGKVAKGDKIATLEAMKMQTNILAPSDGIVAEVLVSVGDSVEAGDLVVKLRA